MINSKVKMSDNLSKLKAAEIIAYRIPSVKFLYNCLSEKDVNGVKLFLP
jgi:hypothetical protein